MAYAFNVNQLPANGSFAIYSLIALLISQGWTDKADSDGTTYASAGGQVTGGGTGAHGLGNNDAWVRLQCPTVNGNKRELTIQRSNSSNTQWRIKYSAAAGFTGGAPGATQTPSAADEVIFVGGGTDAAPTFGFFLPTDGGSRCHACAGGSTESYDFWFDMTPTGGFFTGGSTLWTFDTLQGFDSADVDPTWHSICFYNSGQTPCGVQWLTDTNFQTTATGTGAWMGATSSAANFVGVAAQALQTGSGEAPATGAGSQQFGQSPFSGDDVLLTVTVARGAGNAAPFGPKGILSMGHWSCSFRANGDTMDIGGSKTWIWINGSALPWNGSTPLN